MFVSFVEANDFYNLYSYGIDYENGPVSSIEKNTIGTYTEQDNLKYSGIRLSKPFLALVNSNEITRCDKAGVEIVHPSVTFCFNNYIYDNGFSNIYICDAYPAIYPDFRNIPLTPNSLIGSGIGCYILHTVSWPLIKPAILSNRIKGYEKAGVFVQNIANPNFGNRNWPGGNSICEPASQGAPNFVYEYMPPLQRDITALNNWWGSNDPRDFLIDPHVIYTPWLSSDPFPGQLPKIAIIEEPLPENVSIISTYPNPFNPRTQFEFYLPSSGQVTAKVYDILGRQVKTVINQSLDAGKHTGIWDGRNDLGVPVGSGIYFLQVQSSDKSSSKKITLLK